MKEWHPPEVRDRDGKFLGRLWLKIPGWDWERPARMAIEIEGCALTWDAKPNTLTCLQGQDLLLRNGSFVPALEAEP